MNIKMWLKTNGKKKDGTHDTELKRPEILPTAKSLCAENIM